MAIQRHDLLISIGLLVLRLGFGLYLLAHGWGKLQMLIGGQSDAFMDPVGLGTGTSLVLVFVAEFICGGLVLLGLATRLAALVVGCSMSVAVVFVHGGDPWLVSNASNGSKEPALLFAIALFALVCTGPGRCSLDALLWRRWQRRGAVQRETSAEHDQV